MASSSCLTSDARFPSILPCSSLKKTLPETSAMVSKVTNPTMQKLVFIWVIGDAVVG